MLGIFLLLTGHCSPWAELPERWLRVARGLAHGEAGRTQGHEVPSRQRHVENQMPAEAA